LLNVELTSLITVPVAMLAIDINGEDLKELPAIWARSDIIDAMLK
jgi:hypothetical protein